MNYVIKAKIFLSLSEASGIYAWYSDTTQSSVKMLTELDATSFMQISKDDDSASNAEVAAFFSGSNKEVDS